MRKLWVRSKIFRCGSETGLAVSVAARTVGPTGACCRSGTCRASDYVISNFGSCLYTVFFTAKLVLSYYSGQAENDVGRDADRRL